MKGTTLRILAVSLLIALGASLYSQDAQNLLDSYRGLFARANTGTKLELLKGLPEEQRPQMGPLYGDALLFVINNAASLERDTLLREIALFAVDQIGSIGYREAKDILWRIFDIDRETKIRFAVLNALAVTGKGDAPTVERINTFLSNQNAVYRTGKLPDLQLVGASLAAIGRLGDSSSFPIVFDAMMLGYSDEVRQIALTSLEQIDGDLGSMLLDVIERYSPRHKLQAFLLAMSTSRLGETEKKELALATLNAALASKVTEKDDITALKTLRLKCTAALDEFAYEPAAPSMIRLFNVIDTEYNRGTEPKSSLLEVISCLGKLKTREAAERLTAHLDLINVYTEKDKPYDEQITLAVIRNLGLIGNSLSFDSLIFTKYLNYSQAVKKAADEALASLKW